MSAIKVNLQLKGMDGYASASDEEFPQTARLQDEGDQTSSLSGKYTDGLNEF